MTSSLQDTPLGRAKAGLDACVHCGFCLQACPTYVNIGDENDSPRGRLVLMRRMLDGEIALDDEAAASHIDKCLGCRGCETACPSGVPYGHLLEATRATIAEQRPIPLIAKAVLAVFKRNTLLKPALIAAKLFRDSGIPSLMSKLLPKRLAFPLAMLASTKPNRVNRSSRGPAPVVQASDVQASDVQASAVTQTAALLKGCVMQGLFRHVNTATEVALHHNGFALTQASNQVCCGALHAHAGDLHAARELAKQNIHAFEQSNADVIVVNSAGCAAMMKDYAHLLHDDNEWSARAERVSAKARDASELLAQAGPIPGTHQLHTRVTHDAPCHQMHAQRIVSAPLAVLRAVPGIELVPLEDADQCCGAAGIYNLIEPEVSDLVLNPKLEKIANTKASIVATGNPGCMMQIGAGLMLSGSEARVMHPIELLAASYEQ